MYLVIGFSFQKAITQRQRRPNSLATRRRAQSPVRAASSSSTIGRGGPPPSRTPTLARCATPRRRCPGPASSATFRSARQSPEVHRNHIVIRVLIICVLDSIICALDFFVRTRFSSTH